MKTLSTLSIILLLSCVAAAESEIDSPDAHTKGRAPSESAKPIEIPLKSIWALAMPGSKDVRKLEPELPKGLPNDEYFRRSKVNQIQRILARTNIKEGRKADEGFVVTGNGEEALENAHLVFTGKEKRAVFLPSDTELTLVFFSNLYGRYVHVDCVEIRGRDITVRYHFTSHSTMDMSSHFALIPLGKLPSRKYSVTYAKGPLESEHKHFAVGKTPVSRDKVRRIVCDSFAFVVR